MCRCQIKGSRQLATKSIDANFGALYTEPRVRLESLGVRLHSRRTPGGVQAESRRSPNGVQEDLPGVHKESTRSPQGVQQELTRSPSGVHKDFGRRQHGL
jgi:hypothetical protein